MDFFRIILIVLFTSLSTITLADTTSSGSTDNDQTNTSGSNTTISGGYSSESTTTYEDGSSADTTSTTTNTTTNTSNASRQPVPTASAPSMSAYSQDICATGQSAGLQTPVFGVSSGSTVRDMNCERMKLSKLLNDYGMKVAAVAILCQDPRVFEAMEQAGTPCPFEGKIGGAAVKQWKKYDIERPDYDKYMEKMDDRLKIDERIARDEGTIAENESLKTNINNVAKENSQLQKDIEKLKKVQAELIAAQEAEIKRLQQLVADREEEERQAAIEAAELSVEEQEAADWAEAEITRQENLRNIHEELPENATVEITDEGRVKLTIPLTNVTPGR